MIVEDGSGIAGADAGISEAWFEAYCEARGITVPSGDVEAAIVRATAWIEGRYGSRFPGTPLKGREQGLSFPATGAYDRRGYAIPRDAIPREYMQAIAEATLRELAEAGSLSPDIVPITTGGGAVKRTREKLGPIEEEIEYTEGSTSGVSRPTFPVIDGILAPLLVGGAGMVMLLRA